MYCDVKQVTQMNSRVNTGQSANWRPFSAESDTETPTVVNAFIGVVGKNRQPAAKTGVTVREDRCVKKIKLCILFCIPVILHWENYSWEIKNE